MFDDEAPALTSTSGVLGHPVGWVQVSWVPLEFPITDTNTSPLVIVDANVTALLPALLCTTVPATCTNEMPDASAGTAGTTTTKTLIVTASTAVAEMVGTARR